MTVVKVLDPLFKLSENVANAASVELVVGVFDVLPLTASAPAVVLSALDEAEPEGSGVPSLVRPSNVVICASRVIHYTFVFHQNLPSL